MPERLIIVGSSCRAAAQSATRSDFAAWCVDQFGDEDLRACAEHVEVVHNWPAGILDLIPQIPTGTLVITGALENSPSLLARLRERLPFSGCDVDAMRALRDPVNLQQMLRGAGLKALAVTLGRPSVENAKSLSAVRWLRKPVRSAAGFQIRPLSRSEPVPMRRDRRGPRYCYQEFAAGETLSGLFLADGSECRLLCLTQQLIGLPEAGAGRFRYCGSIGPLSTRDVSRRAFEMAADSGQVLTQATGCRGLFGVDFIWNAESGELSVCEVNPRYTASAELFEQAASVPLLRWHVEACRQSFLPPAAERDPIPCHGKLICFAQQPFPSAALSQVRGLVTLADIPNVETVIPAGHPICTALATGDSPAAVRGKLLAAARRVYEAGEQTSQRLRPSQK